MTQHDPTPDVPVFRLVRDTADLPIAVRFVMGLRAGFIEPFEPAEPREREMN